MKKKDRNSTPELGIKNRLSKFNENHKFSEFSQALTTDTMRKKIIVKFTEYKKNRRVRFKPIFVETVEIESYKKYNYEGGFPVEEPEKKKIHCRCNML